MPKKKDWTAVVQGNLKVLYESGVDSWGNILWECRCSCGNTATVTSAALTKGQKSCSISCGVAASNRKRARHGLYQSKEHQVWRQMRSRCNNPNDTSYPRYGGRGITVCKRWGKFENFYADMGAAPEGTTLDRINNNKGYSPSNCRWATPQQQQNNMRSNVTVTYKGKTQTLAEWARETGIAYHVLKRRYTQGWDYSLVFSKRNFKGIPYKLLEGSDESDSGTEQLPVQPAG